MLLLGGALAALWFPQEKPVAAKEPADGFTATALPLVRKYCLECHSAKVKKGSLDLERFASADLVRRDVKPWQQSIEMLEAHEMPPKGKPQPTAEEQKQLIAWIRGFLDTEARARAGDPGHVPLRRLSNAEYDLTVKGLTGVDLRPTREFPADGAGGEGFTNAAEALTEISPALLTKYLNAAKDTAEHAVLLPDGFRFSAGKTRRDWTDESTAKIKQFYAQFGADGRLPVKPYLAATVKHRDGLLAGTATVEEVARVEKLNAKYLGALWATLTAKAPSYPLDGLRAKWATATAKDVDGLAADMTAWQTVLWKIVQVGSYRYGNTVRQVANDPPAAEAQTLRVAVKPAPGQADVTVRLAARDLTAGRPGPVIWGRPRFEGAGKPTLLLKDYASFGPAFEVDFPAVFADTPKYLAAVAELARDKALTADAAAKKHGLDAAFLKRWADVLALAPTTAADPFAAAGPAVALQLLTEKTGDEKSAVKGWHAKGSDLPVLVGNTSNDVQRVPGTINAHKVAVHPLPKEFVAVAWKSPAAGAMTVTAAVTHAHPVCGNGVAWRLEHRRAGKAVTLDEGALNVGQAAKPAARKVTVEKGDELLLVVDAKNGDHSCDLTEIDFTVREVEITAGKWDLAADVSGAPHAGNPHGVWSFVKGPSQPVGKAGAYAIPSGSALGKWRTAALDPAKAADAEALAKQVQALLTSPRPVKDGDPDRVLFDLLVTGDSVLFQGVDVAKLAKPRPGAYGLPAGRFAKDDVPADTAAVVEIRLPAALFRDREFVIEGKRTAADQAVWFQAYTAAAPAPTWDGKSPVVAPAAGPAYQALLAGFADFRTVFPTFHCFPDVVPNDEVVTLKMYHREDEPLARLMLSDEQKKQIDRLWEEHRFISQQPVAENKYLPLFIGFVTQDQPKELLNYFEGQRPAFQKRADDYERDVAAAVPPQLEKLLAFAGQAYRRPLHEREKAELSALYRGLRDKGVAHEEALRGVLARVLVAPAFLFRVEQAPAGAKAGPVGDWELATRLSYFLTSAGPDDELRALAAAGQLREPKVLEAQTRRLLKDDKIRALAVEFGTQWLHVRGFDELKEKNEKLFPMFDANLKAAIYEESILFFQDLFQQDRPVTAVLDADYTYLNELLAKHYGVPGVAGPQFRRVDGIKKFGRGGILGLASVQTKQAGASRTSPVLRGNWVVETLLGEKLPRPPANVPALPEEEGADKLTMRQQTERHTRDAACAVCHVRIDPFGFAFEKYDPIGRRRDKDLAGNPVDTKAKLKDGAEFDGLDGLRDYLMAKKKDVIVRLFCQRLLGYALGRQTSLSDQALIDEMAAALAKNGVSAAVLTAVQSPQFRMIRGADAGE